MDHTDYVQLLRELRAIPGVKKVFVRSGLRYDYMMGEEDDTFLTELVRYHISGQLKVAPEHCSARVLDEMGKPHINVYEAFLRRFQRICHYDDAGPGGSASSSPYTETCEVKLVNTENGWRFAGFAMAY